MSISQRESSFEFTPPTEPPEPNYLPVPTLEDSLRADAQTRFEAQLEGAGTFLDDGTNRWHWVVFPGNPGVLTITLQASDIITWWKRVEISASFFGHWFPIRRLETANQTRVSSIDLNAASSQSGTVKLDFWKAGFLNSGSWVHAEVLDIPAHLGQTILILCSRDSWTQP
jgi:hypothetical protein